MFKKIVTKFVLIFVIASFCAPLVFAQEDVTDPTPGGMEAGTPLTTNNDKLGSFDVSQYLQIKDGQSYLDSESTTDGKTNLKKGLVYFIIRFVELLTKIIGSFALLFVITGGIILMASHGNSQLQTRGKQMILYALLGLIVAFLSLIIVTFVQSLFFTT